MRGQVMTKRMPTVQQGLEERGVGILKFEILTVPGDPNKIFTNVAFSRPMSELEKKRMGTLDQFIQLLLEEVTKEPNIQVLCGSNCEGVVPSEDCGLEANCRRASDGASLSFHANLVV